MSDDDLGKFVTHVMTGMGRKLEATLRTARCSLGLKNFHAEDYEIGFGLFLEDDRNASQGSDLQLYYEGSLIHALDLHLIGMWLSDPEAEDFGNFVNPEQYGKMADELERVARAFTRAANRARLAASKGLSE